MKKNLGLILFFSFALFGTASIFSNEAQAAQINQILRGTIKFDTDDVAQSVDIGANVVTAKSIILLSVTSDSVSTVRDQNNFFNSQFEDTNTIFIQRAGGTHNASVSWQVVEFVSGVTVQRGISSLSNGSCPTGCSKSITLPASIGSTTTVVPILQSVAAFSNNTTDLEMTDFLMLSGTFPDVNTLTVTRGNNSSSSKTVSFTWQVMEFTTDATIQNGSVTSTINHADDTTFTSTLTTPLTNGGQNALLFFTINGGTAINGQDAIMCTRGRIKDAYTVEFIRHYQPNTANKTVAVQWYVVDFKEASSGYPLGFGKTDGTVTGKVVVDAATSRNINSSANNGGLIQITTSASHGFVAGQWVLVQGHNQASANGWWSIAAIPSGTTLTLTGSTYVANGNASGTVATTCAISSSTDATPIVVTTAVSHGIVAGDLVNISGHTTNTNANGNYVVSSATATTLTLTGATATGAGAGGATGVVVKAQSTTISTVTTARTVAMMSTTASGASGDSTSDDVFNDLSFASYLVNSTTIEWVRDYTSSAFAADHDYQFFEFSPITLTAPNGAESWAVGSTQTVTWTNSADVAAHAWKLQYSTSNNTKSIGSSTNATPIVITSNSHGLANGDEVAISGHTTNTNANGYWTVAGVTTNTFQLTGSVGNGVGGATGTIDAGPSWSDMGSQCGAGGSSACTGSTLSTGSVSIKIPDNLGTSTRFRIYDTTDSLADVTKSNQRRQSDGSNANFTIKRSLTLTGPSAGANWTVGDTTRYITWDYTGSTNWGTVKVQYSTNNGGAWTDIATGLAVNNDGVAVSDTPPYAGHGRYLWNPIPDLLSASTSQTMVRVIAETTTADGLTPSSSSSNFNILRAITLTRPVGGESDTAQTNWNITWTNKGQTGWGTVKLEYSTDAPHAVWSTIATGQSVGSSGSGSYTATTIPVAAVGTTVKVRVTSESDTSISSTSSSDFTIVAKVSVTYPNGSEVLYVDNSATITWTTSGSLGALNTVKIEFSRDGLFDDTITVSASAPATNVDTTHGQFANYTLPNAIQTSATAKIKVTSLDNTAITDTSDAGFTLKGKIDTLVPGGGEVYSYGDSVPVSWNFHGNYSTNYGAQNLEIKLSSDGGASYPTVLQTVSLGSGGSGSWSWATGTQTPATNYDIKVQLQSDSSVVYVTTSTSSHFRIKGVLAVTAPNGSELWSINDTSRNITWTKSPSSLGSSDIYYSTAGVGGPWTLLASSQCGSVTSSCSYNWNPISSGALTTSQTAAVKVQLASDSTVSDASDSPYKVEGALAITSPNGSESWLVGDSHNITWTSNPASQGNVNLYYSTNAGSTFPNLITGSAVASNSSPYAWTVPDAIGSQTQVKVIAVNDGAVLDASDANFTVKPKFTMTSPNTGSEVWTVGAGQSITWNTSGTVSQVNLYSSSNSGGAWSPIVSNLSNIGSYNWGLTGGVADAIGTTNQIKVESSADSSSSDASDNDYTIKGSLTVTSPNSNSDVLIVGGSKVITWTETGTLGNVKILYSTDGGATYPDPANVITSSVAASNLNYNWSPIPDAIGTNVKIKIMQTGASPNNAFDESDQAFSIKGSLTITAPNGSENYFVGQNYPISWTKTGTLGNIKLVYSTDSGATYPEPGNVIATGLAATSSPYTWSVADIIGSNVRVKAILLSDSLVNDESNNDFNVKGTITLTSPVGGETWVVGTSHPITWTRNGNSMGNIKIEYSTDGGVSYPNTITGSVASAALSQNWTIPDNIGNQVRVKLTLLSDAATNSASSSDFSIKGGFAVTSPNGNETWVVGDIHNITWTTSGTVANVKLYYATDSATFSNVITQSSIVNSGTYSWTVPDAIGTHVQVKVENAADSAVYDVSNADFTIKGSVALTSPNGSNTLSVGGSHLITWTETGSLGNVKILYSTDGGATYPDPANVITAATLASNLNYNWTNIPDSISTNVKVKVTQTGSAPNDSYDESDAALAIKGTITIATPNGGEQFNSGSNNNITWTKTGSIGNIKLVYSNDSGANYTEPDNVITGSVAASALSYTWNVPDGVGTGTQFRVKAILLSDSAINDTSNNDFSIKGTLTLTAPNGAETWTVNSPRTITWTRTGGILNAKLEYTTDNGSNWNLITGSTSAAALSYGWTIPDAVSDTVKVRITDAADASVNDTSDANFYIKPIITLTAPNGGEAWVVGTAYDITWTRTGTIVNVKLDYSTDGGSTFPNSIISSTGAGALSYTWTIPDTISNQGVVRISKVGDASVFDDSDAFFKIKGSLTLTSPNGLESWGITTHHDITWTRTGTVGTVKLEYSTDGGSTYPNVITNDGSLNSSALTYDWTIPDNPSSQIRVKITSLSDSTVFDASNGNSAIVGTLFITAPNGGETWIVGASNNIVWTKNGNISTVKFEYSADGGSTYPNSIATGVSAAALTYAWTVPDDIGSQLRVKITDEGNANVNDTSNANFTIKGSVVVTAPNGNEIWNVGSSQNITWTKTGTIGNVKLEYTTDGGSNFTQIASGIPSTDLSYAWTVADVLSSTVKVKITQESDTSVNDLSNSNFKIRGVLTLTSPNGGEAWVVGQSNNITWTRVGTVANVKLEYSNDGGTTYPNLIVASTAGNAAYPWTVADTISTQVKIRVTDVNDATVLDTSDANFTVKGSLAVTAPNGGESWQVDSSHNITWSKTGTFANVKIEYSTNGGVAWTEITASTNAGGATGSFSWTLPDSLTSSGRVKVTNLSDSSVNDASDSNFKIVGGLTIGAPNGTENWAVASHQSITWTRIGSISTVKLEYTTDGNNYTTIDASTPGSDLSYDWVIPDAVSTTVKVRITDVNESSVTDVSDANFAILAGFAITSPNGGEVWTVSSGQSIQWTTSGTAANVKLEYSTDGGNNYSDITASTSNTGSYSWTVPNSISTTVRVRVSDVNNANAKDVSSANFKIQGSFTLTSPNGTESWDVASSHNITWTKVGSIANAKLELSKDAGSTYPVVIIASTDATTLTYAWTIPDQLTTQGRVKISDASDSTVYDVSDANFTIKGAVTLNSPNGGETWVVSSAQNITWTRFGSVLNVKLEYSTNSGTTFPNLITAATDATTGTYAWSIPDAISTQLRVKITDVDNSLVFDTSNADFAIKGAVTLNSPNGGETWLVGASQNITWTRTGSIANMKLEYSTNSGSTYPNLIVASTDATQPYAWTIPDAIGSALRVKVTDASNATVTDTSNADFAVRGSVTLTSPNGGEAWNVNSSHNITWTKTGTFANVKLEYSVNGGNTYPNTITASTDASTQSYAWTIPNAIGTQLRVRITQTDDASVTDTSNADFEVKGVLALTAPNGGEAWSVNSSQNITWTRAGSIANVRLEYSTNSGSTYPNLIVASTDASTGTYAWTIPDVINSTLRVKVSDATDAGIPDTSDANFKIIGSLTLTAPNGGELWTVGTSHNITWTKVGSIANVKLEYTTDGSSYTTIVGSTGAAGLSYTWTSIPDAVSTTVKVRISDAADATVLDLSDANFSILGGFTITAPNGGEVWTVSSSQSIAWTTAGTVSNVKLEYSTDGGSTYPNQIVASTSNTESYSWTIPDAIGTTLKVKVSDAANANAFDVSNATFKIRGSLTVTAPNGGEAWTYNTHNNITWTKVGSIANVRLEYSTDGGSTYPNVIAASVDATSATPYDWTVPDALTLQARVKVTDASDSTVFDTSNADFSIKGALTVTAPNGGESWVVGAVQNVTWTRVGSIANVKLEYSTNSGGTYPNLIIASTDATTGTYAWTVPDAPTLLSTAVFRVKATDVANSTVSDVSNANFTIKGALTVTAPNGGEILFVGNSTNVTWARTGTVSNVKIEYSTNSGSTYPNVVVATTDASSGSYSWTVPDAIGTTLRVRVSDTTDATVVDTSNADFTVKGQVTLTSPNGGEVWVVNTAQNIVWSRNGSIAFVKLEYSTNGGSTFPNVITASTDASTGTYSWTIPDAITTQGRVRISATNDNSVKDDSDSNFAIKGSILVTAPNGGESWAVGTNQNITWTKAGSIANVQIVYSTDGGSTYPTEIINATDAATGSYSWAIPDDLSIQGRVKVINSTDATIFDFSNSNFKIVGALTLTAPNGGEQWKINTAYNITWTRTGNIQFAKLEYSTDGGATYPNQITASTPAGGLSYNWTVPDTAGTAVKVRVSDASDATVNDVSNANFKIQATFTVTSPNGSEIWTVGESHNITWSTVGTVTNVKLEYSSDGGSNYSTISASTGNTGTYGWTVPDAISATTLVRVSDVNDAAASDVSNAVFKIRGALTLTSPNGVESWDVASAHNITWTKTGTIANVKLEYSTDGGSTYPNQIVASTPGANLSYAWTIPDAISTTLRVKVTDTTDSTVNDISDANFTIKGALTLTAPNGGEAWTVATAQNITWTRFGSIPNVKLEYSVDGGGTYPNVITASTDASLLSYSWTIPDDIHTTSRVKISDTGNSAVFDTSNANFAIIGAFTLISPNGGEVWVVGESRNITWSRVGSIINAKLEYSTDGGSSYSNLIIGVTDASTGTYGWTVPDAIGTQLRVKITDTSNSTVFDTSNADFVVKGSLTLTAPNGGETWIVGQANNVTWSRSGTISTVKLEYSTNGGSTYPNTITASTNGLTGSYSWAVPDAIGTSVRVRVSDTSDASVNDTSNADFTIKGSLVVTSPNGGEAWVVNSSHNITWTKTGTFANVKIEYSTNSGSTYPNTISASTSASALSFAWTIPDDIQSNVRVKVTNLSDTTVNDASDTNFKIVGSFTLTAPNGSELWKVNTNQNVTWTKVGSIANAKLEFSMNGGSTYPNTIIASTPANAAYTWTIPDNLTTQARVRVSDASDSTVLDISDANFQIVGSFAVTAPNGGEVWTVNASQNITWSTVGSVTNVKLEYSTDGGTNYSSTIAASTSNSGTFSWTIPDSISSTVRVRISDVANANAADTSDANFKIRGALALTAPNGGESWNVNTSHAITWTRTGSVANVKLEYSTDQGSTYPNLINGSVDASLLTYNWTIPDAITANARVKVTDASDPTVYDDSNANFRIRGTFTLTSPNGAEVWDVASAHNITWTKVGSISDAKLEYSTDGGGTFPNTIVGSIDASSSPFSWTIPDSISTQVRVKITDVSDSVVNDISDANFKIRGVLTLTSPNGGETWNVASSHNITWTKQGTISNAKLEYSTNGGSTYPNVITNSVLVSDLSYAWTVPDSISPTVRVKITNLSDATVTSSSVTDFKITGLLVLTSPNGGEVWSVASSQAISWTKTGSITNAKLEYSQDGGVNYDTVIIASTLAANLSYSWTVPDVINATMRVKISDASDASVFDTSDANFKIRGSFTLTSPNGAEAWVIGSTHHVTWTKNGSIANAKLELSKTAGADNYPISIISSIAANTLDYTWAVPDEVSTQCRVKISQVGDSTIFDNSDANFTIRGGFTVTSPVGGENWAVGESHDLTWVTGGTINNVKLQYSSNAGASWTTIISSTPNNQVYTWSVADAITTQARIQVSDVNDAQAADSSPANFKIHGTFTLTAPNGGEQWQVGSTQAITWTKTGSIANAKLEYSTDSGVTYPNLIIGSTPASALTYNWTIPDAIGNNVKLKITDATDSTVTDDSNSVFKIKGQFTVTSPNGSENWIVATSHNITWGTLGTVANVKLEYSTDAGATYNTITVTTPNTGTYSWTIPDAITTQGRVRVSDASDSAASDQSDSNFKIRGSLTLTAPNGGEKWNVGTNHLITWDRTGSIPSVKIEFSSNNGTVYTLVDATPNNNTGAYSWTIPDSITTQGLIRISDLSDNTIVDTSDASFKVMGNFTMTSPNGGEVWTVTSSQNLTWTSSGTMSFAKLEYSTNGGSSYNLIVGSTANNGLYSWTVPDAVSGAVKIKVSDPNDSDAYDESNANFRIRVLFSLTAPNGGQKWTVGRNSNITWSSIGTIANVKLQYSRDGFLADINTINAAAPNTGTYSWLVPDTISNTVRVRVSDPNDIGAIKDSAADFKIMAGFVVTSPNGGEKWDVSSNNDITWTSTGTVSDVKIEYSTNGGASYPNAIAATPNTGTYTWTIPNDISAQVKVRVSDLSDTVDAFDASDANLKIRAKFTITSPNGSEIWTVAESHNITWTTIGTVANVKLDYSTDSGSTYPNVINSGASNTGTYSWTIPDSISTNVRVRVMSTLDVDAFDASDANFKVRGAFAVTSPNGGELWKIAQVNNITWTTTGTMSTVKIAYSTDSGATFPNVISASTANNNTYSWTVPDVPTIKARVHVEYTSDSTVYDDSNGDFRIQGFFALTAPNGGEAWIVASAQNITWNWGGTIPNVKLSYSKDSGATYPNIIVASTANGAGSSGTYSYSWTVPDDIDTHIRVKVEDPNDNTVFSASAADFKIRGSFTVTAPNGSERWVTYETKNITWNTSGTIPNVKLEYSYDDFVTPVSIAASVANTGTYSWSIPDPGVNNVPKASKIRVTDVNDSTVSDKSDATFNIDYYLITWEVRDLLTNAPLSLLSVNEVKATDPNFNQWSEAGVSTNPPRVQPTPGGTWVTTWSKTGFGDAAQVVVADHDQSFLLYMETSTVHIWLADSRVTYDPSTDTLDVVAWLSRDGALAVGGVSSAYKIYDGTTLIATLTDNAVNSAGFFDYQLSAPTGLLPGKVYTAISEITVGTGGVFKTPTSFEITTPTKLQEVQDKVNATLDKPLSQVNQELQATLNAQTTVIQTKLDDQTTVINTKLDEQTTKIETALDNFQTQVHTAVEELQSGAEQSLAAAAVLEETALKFSWKAVVAPNPALSGDNILLQTQGPKGLHPYLSVYNHKNKQVIANGIMEEDTGRPGNYSFVFSAKAGDFDPGQAYTYVVTEDVTGGLVAGSGFVESISLTAVAGLASAAPAAERAAKEAVEAIRELESTMARGGDIRKALLNLQTAVSDIPTQVAKISGGDTKRIKSTVNEISERLQKLAGSEGMDLSSIFKRSIDESSTIQDIRSRADNITQSLELLGAVVQKRLGGSDEPVVATFLE